jgi:hypothetical protein
MFGIAKVLLELGGQLLFCVNAGDTYGKYQ